MNNEKIRDIIETHDNAGLTDYAIDDMVGELYELCQPQWIYVSERLPEEAPHRNVEIAYLDAANNAYSAKVASRLVSTMVVDCYAWRETGPLPQPPKEDEYE